MLSAFSPPTNDDAHARSKSSPTSGASEKRRNGLVHSTHRSMHTNLESQLVRLAGDGYRSLLGHLKRSKINGRSLGGGGNKYLSSGWSLIFNRRENGLGLIFDGDENGLSTLKRAKIRLEEGEIKYLRVLEGLGRSLENERRRDLNN